MGSTPGISTATKLTICLFFPSVWSAKIGRHMEAEFADSRKGQQAIIVYEINYVTSVEQVRLLPPPLIKVKQK